MLNKNALEEHYMLNTKIVTITAEDAEGVTLEIAVNKAYNDKVVVESVTMYVTLQEQDGYFYDSDLAVNYNTDKLQNDETAQTMGTMLLRNLNSNDEVTQVMSEFYWEHSYNDELKEILLNAGFSASAVAEVRSSEWGMQDEGRASYDASEIADEVRAHIAEITMLDMG
jgi:hypothetical protein